MAYGLVDIRTLEILAIEASEAVVSLPFKYIACDDAATINWDFDGEYISAPADAVEKARVRIKALVAKYRYEKEVAGVSYMTKTIATDRDSQGKIAAVKTLAQEAIDANDTGWSVDWKCVDGWLTMTAVEAVAMADAVAAHVKDQFAEEKRLSDVIDGLTTETEVMEYEFVDAWTA
jgi:hypothetical protein